ncbi:MAG: polysaccharide biosynthesis/export family protein [Spirosomataceae bacterium]
MRLLLLFLLFCTQIRAQKNSPDTTKTSQTIIIDRFVVPVDTAVYRLKAGDRLRIRSLNALEIIYPQAGNLSVGSSPMASGQAGNASFYQTTVDRLGQIILPQIGRVKVAGLSKAEAVNELERRYQNLINNPVFDIEITNLHIRVLGSVTRQGVIPLENEKLTLGEVIALSGGIDFGSADRTIKLIRTRAGIQQEINFDIRNLSDPAIANIPVFDGDYVFVPPSKGSIRTIKNQRVASILSPIAIGLNAFAVVLSLYLTIR